MHHTFVVSIHIGFVGIGGKRPVMHTGFHFLHRKVGAFNYPNLNRASTLGDTFTCPLGEIFLHLMGIWQIGLQYDTGTKRQKLLFHQHLLKRITGKVQVSVFLHVEVHKLR